MTKIMAIQFQAGHFYVNDVKGTVREVIRLIDEQTLAYREFDLFSGKPLTTVQHNCSNRKFLRWADRDATPAEVQDLDCAGAIQLEQENAREMALLFLESVPDEMLIAELKRRGMR